MSVSFLTPSFDAPVDVTRTPVDGSLAHDLAAGATTAALTFAGQGWRWWEDLEQLLARRSWLRERAERWSAMLAEHCSAPAMVDLGALPDGFDPLRWIDDASSRPTDGELSSLAVSLPGVLLTQLLTYREAWEDGLAGAVEAGSIVAATGHSGGIIAAAAVATQPDGLDDDDLLDPFLHLSVLLGHLAGTCEHAVSAAVLDAALRGDVDAPTPMVAVGGLRRDRVEQLLAADELLGVDELPGTDEPHGAARVALQHGPRRVVVSGSPKGLAAARSALERAVDADPAGGRLQWEPLAVSAPCHHPMLGDVVEQVLQAARDAGLTLPPPVDGVELILPDGPRAAAPGDDLVAELVSAMLVRPGHWDRTATALATGAAGSRPAEWVLDLGPTDGVARLSAAATAGTGSAVLALALDEDRRALVAAGAAARRTAASYERFAPGLVTLPDGTTRLDNRFTRATGRAPIVLAGMTPTTVDAPIVAAAANAGFVAELAGGGQVTEEIFTERLAELSELLEPGHEVVFNALHLDPYLWGLHLGRTRAVQRARRAGAPICGVTVSAGIPSTDAAVELLDELVELGMWCNAFKPGTHEQIRQVAEIAAAAPHHTIFVHVEGGSAGGHHSWVDLEDLLLGGYRSLRAHDNVVLCAGGGVGTPERAAELLTGRWSLRHTDVAMPVDAVLVGTAAMACAEATATAGVKAALAAARGSDATVGRGRWSGGVTSGRSGLDADIHFLDNSASRCAALLDEVAGDPDAVSARSDEIVLALGRTAKPYFGDVASMTYEQLLRRFVELAAIGRGGRYDDGAWLDVSHRDRFLDLLRRAEARVHPQESGTIPTLFPDRASVDDPEAALGRLLDRFPVASSARLHPADPAYFLHVCRAAGKPVPFVPVLDGDVRRWYQSDSLWQAQHPAYDADQVLVIPGPAAVAGIGAGDEPVAELLARFEDGVRRELSTSGVAVPAVPRRRRRGVTAGLSGPIAALLDAPTVVLDGRIVPNPVLCVGAASEWATTSTPDGRLLDAELVMGADGAEHVALHAGERGTSDSCVVTLTLTWPGVARYGAAQAAGRESVSLRFTHDQRAGVDVLTLDTDARRAELSRLLREVLVGDVTAATASGLGSGSVEVVFDDERRRRHARLLGMTGDAASLPLLPDSLLAVVWPSVFRCFDVEHVVGSLLDLVHLEHRVVVTNAAPATWPSTVEVHASIVAIDDHEAGTRVDTRAEIVTATDVERERVVRAVVHGSFLLRGVAVPGRAGDESGADPVAAEEAARVQDRPRRTLAELVVRAPADMRSFASMSGDHNPIHRSIAVARLVGLDGPIVHGAWTSAVAQRALVDAACDGRPERLVDWSASFLGVVLPGDEVVCSVVRTGVIEGDTVCEVTASVVRDDARVPVLSATARVRAPRTAYLFPGQGIQRQGMGMDGYERSSAARRVWDRADAHTRRRLGFSILSIVRDNPTTLSVALADGGAEVHRHPAGVLHLTQFTQVAMAALAMAQVAELREDGVFDESAVVAGHSVGEYNALASIGGVLPLEVIVELVFRRGQSMHHLVPRDAEGRSDYRLGVIRPHQIDMDHAEVDALVRDLAERLGETLEIVNYNLRDKQYAVAGTLASLDALESELEARRPPGSKEPFLYVPGIDVPFHSAVLRDGVDDFRAHLDAGLPERIDPALLVGRYVPNLVPRAFSLEREFVDEVRAYVDSASLTSVLEDWDRWSADPARLCRELLIELLAWQFASPVRWIETQDLLFADTADGGLGVERIVEVGLGSQPTVANLAKGTLAMRPAGATPVTVYNVESDRLAVVALEEDPEPVEPEPVEPAQDEPAPDAAAPTVVVAPAPVAASSGGPAEIEDRPVGAGEALQLLLAMSIKVRPDQLSGSETIDDLVDGVSSRRNQLLMDLGTEFAISGMDGARELPLEVLTAEIAGRVGRYRFPGPVLRESRDAALAGVLGPLRLKSRDVESRVTGHWGLGAGWVERVLTGLGYDGRSGESTRGGALGRLHPVPSSADDAIDAALALVAADLGVALADPSAGSAAGAVDVAVVTELEDRIAGPDGLLADIARDVLARVAPDGGDVEPVDTSATDRLALLDAEHGERRAAAVRPMFDARRHVVFSSWWATARHDVVALHHDGMALDADAPALDAAALDEEADRLARAAVDPGVRAAARWFAGRAAERGDAHAVRRFERLAAGGDGTPARWVPPVEPVRPVLDGGVVDEQRCDPSRVRELIDMVRAANGGALDGVSTADWVAEYARCLDAALHGTDAQGQPEVALVTGASPGSIAYEVVRRLLADGATVVCTTSDDRPERLADYRELYRTAAAPGAELHVVRANLASFGDIDDLVDWMVRPTIDEAGGVRRTLKDPMLPTLVLPFAAGPVAGDLVDVDGSSEVALRVLLLGVERLLGAVAEARTRLGDAGRRTTVVLPMSPNHGGFGGDGTYGEAKAALEVVLEKWGSEHRRWGERLHLVAATIGWVRGTGLMDANDAMAALVERDLPVRTFSAQEMGWLVHSLASPAVRAAAGDEPLRVDLSGGLGQVESLHDALAPLARELQDLHDATSPDEPRIEESVTIGALLDPVGIDRHQGALPRTGRDATATWTPAPEVDLDDMVVVVGAGEVGPWGSSATRFDLELDGELEAGSIAELAWTCGLVRWEPDVDGGAWIDTEADEVVAEGELAERYRDAVHERCGIRTFTPDGPLDPEGVSLVVEVFVDHDVVIDVAGEADARAFAAADPEHTDVRRSPTGDWQVVRRAGSTIRVPRRAELTRTVGAQVPTGFDPTRWGIPAEMAASVDRLSLWNLVATVEAFLDAGIEPEELMARVHPARVGNTQGSGMGGMSSIQTLYRDAVLGGDHANDLLQEGLGNVIAAYVVQAYVGSYGPMVHPVAACATAAVSIEDGVDKIRAGKADVVVAGGWDDLGLEGVQGFAEMSATAPAAKMHAAGLAPDQFSRSNDRRRGGFVEAQGGGTVLLARASVAADLGLPVRAVVVYAGSFADGIHTSIPAPGLGALACVLGGRRSALATALSRHGLGADDIGVVSKHDTSTAANDPNESELHQRIAEQLGRSPGNPMLVVSQKTVTGHAKGGAAAWQAIGLAQVLETGEVPGNRNLECLDESHRDHTHLVYGHRPMRSAEPLRAGLLTSLGFGHVSAVLCLGNSSIFDAALTAETSPEVVTRYRRHAASRAADGRRRRVEGRFGGAPAYTKRTDRRLDGDEASPERRTAEAALLTDRGARLGPDGRYRTGGADDAIPAGGA